MVQATIAEIEAGEAFQIVVSQRFDVATSSDALQVYRALRLTNPSPYLYLLRLPGFAVVGSSPASPFRTGLPPRAPSLGRGRGDAPRGRTGNSRPSCWPTRRNGLST